MPLLILILAAQLLQPAPVDPGIAPSFPAGCYEGASQFINDVGWRITLTQPSPVAHTIWTSRDAGAQFGVSTFDTFQPYTPGRADLPIYWPQQHATAAIATDGAALVRLCRANVSPYPPMPQIRARWLDDDTVEIGWYGGTLYRVEGDDVVPLQARNGGVIQRPDGPTDAAEHPTVGQRYQVRSADGRTVLAEATLGWPLRLILPVLRR